MVSTNGLLTKVKLYLEDNSKAVCVSNLFEKKTRAPGRNESLLFGTYSADANTS